MDHFAERRKKYYINKQFQRNFIIKFCGLVLVGSVISSLIIYLMTTSTVTTTFENSKLTIKSTADFIMPAVLLSSAVVFILVGIATIAITLFTSHRIAGPLYRIEKDINEITAGKLNIVFHLRHGDEIKPIAASLNNMAVSLRVRIGEIKSELAELEKMSESAGSNIPAAMKEKIRRVKATIDKFTI